jgi:hypothetical protein
MKHYLFIFLILFIFSNISKAQSVITLGAGTNSVTNTAASGSPISQWYKTIHYQTIYTKTEINAQGIASGTISKIGFNVNTGTTYAWPHYIVKMKHTPNSLCWVDESFGMTTVLTLSNYQPTLPGFNMLSLDLPFAWNGTDNLVIDICADTLALYAMTGGIVFMYDVTTPYSSRNSYSDVAAACSYTTQTPLQQKPQIRFEFSSYSTDVSLHELQNNKYKMKTQPNPTSEALNISYELDKEHETSVELVNLLGESIKLILPNQLQSQGKHEQNISVEELPSGIYFIKLKINQSESVEKIVITH